MKHVKNNFPNSKIRNKKIFSIGINDFEKYFKKKTIDYFSIDIEGADYDVMMKLNLNKYAKNILSICILTNYKKELIN